MKPYSIRIAGSKLYLFTPNNPCVFDSGKELAEWLKDNKIGKEVGNLDIFMEPLQKIATSYNSINHQFSGKSIPHE